MWHLKRTNLVKLKAIEMTINEMRNENEEKAVEEWR
jgi:hypothetical protein